MKHPTLECAVAGAADDMGFSNSEDLLDILRDNGILVVHESDRSEHPQLVIDNGMAAAVKTLADDCNKLESECNRLRADVEQLRASVNQAEHALDVERRTRDEYAAQRDASWVKIDTARKLLSAPDANGEWASHLIRSALEALNG